MSTAVWTNRLGLNSVADTALKAAARFWFVVAVIGQWAFMYYIVAFYGTSTFTGNFQAWSKNRGLFKGYVPGDTAGNLVFASHALLAAVIAFGGAIQLIPWIRTRALAFHRWNGRLFFVTASGLSLSGLYMNWVRGARADVVGAIATSLNAVLIFSCIGLAWRSVRAREISSHRRWAVRTYLLANAQWFIRIGVVACFIINRGQVGMTKSFFYFADFACYLLPLFLLELYLCVKDRASPSGQFAMAGVLVVFTLFMAVGIFGFYMFTRPLLQAMK